MVNIELEKGELLILVDMLQVQKSLGTQETALLKKLATAYKEIVTTSLPPE